MNEIILITVARITYAKNAFREFLQDVVDKGMRGVCQNVNAETPAFSDLASTPQPRSEVNNKST